MLKIIKQGKKPSDGKNVLKFKCEFCKCVFKTDKYETFEFRVADIWGQRIKHFTFCPCYGENVNKWE